MNPPVIGKLCVTAYLAWCLKSHQEWGYAGYSELPDQVRDIVKLALYGGDWLKPIPPKP